MRRHLPKTATEYMLTASGHVDCHTTISTMTFGISKWHHLQNYAIGFMRTHRPSGRNLKNDIRQNFSKILHIMR